MPEYPDCFPSDFEARILPSEAKCQDVDAYRVAVRGKNGSDAFLSTLEEGMRYPNPARKEPDLNYYGTFSTSCCKTLKAGKKALKMMNKFHPAPTLLGGRIVSECGPSLVLPKDDHIHWWLYKDGEPWIFFEEVNVND